MADINEEAGKLASLEQIINGADSRVAQFSYDMASYEQETADSMAGTGQYDYSKGNNIPLADADALGTNMTVLVKGVRAQSSSIPRNLLNHFFGRVSFNLNKIHEWFARFLGFYREDLRKNCNLWSPTTAYQKNDVCFTLTLGEDGDMKLRTWIATTDVSAGAEPGADGVSAWKIANDYDYIVSKSIKTDKLDAGELLTAGLIKTANIADGAVTREKIAPGAVSSDQIMTGAVTSAKLGASAVGTMNIADGAVTADKLAEGVISDGAIADGAVTTDKIEDGAVTGSKLAHPLLLPVTYTEPGTPATPPVWTNHYGYFFATSTYQHGVALATLPILYESSYYLLVKVERSGQVNAAQLIRIAFGDRNVVSEVVIPLIEINLKSPNPNNFPASRIVVTDNGLVYVYLRSRFDAAKQLKLDLKAKTAEITEINYPVSGEYSLSVAGMLFDSANGSVIITNLTAAEAQTRVYAVSTASGNRNCLTCCGEGDSAYFLFFIGLFYVVIRVDRNDTEHAYFKVLDTHIVDDTANNGKVAMFVSGGTLTLCFINARYNNKDTNGYSGNCAYALSVHDLTAAGWAQLPFSSDADALPDGYDSTVSASRNYVASSGAGISGLSLNAWNGGAPFFYAIDGKCSIYTPTTFDEWTEEGSFGEVAWGSVTLDKAYDTNGTPTEPVVFAQTRNGGLDLLNIAYGNTFTLSTVESAYATPGTPAIPGAVTEQPKQAGAGVTAVTEGADGSRTLTLGTGDVLKFGADGQIDAANGAVTMQQLRDSMTLDWDGELADLGPISAKGEMQPNTRKEYTVQVYGQLLGTFGLAYLNDRNYKEYQCGINNFSLGYIRTPVNSPYEADYIQQPIAAIVKPGDIIYVSTNNSHSIVSTNNELSIVPFKFQPTGDNQ